MLQVVSTTQGLPTNQQFPLPSASVLSPRILFVSYKPRLVCMTRSSRAFLTPILAIWVETFTMFIDQCRLSVPASGLQSSKNGAVMEKNCESTDGVKNFMPTVSICSLKSGDCLSKLDTQKQVAFLL